jgi:hypothetical protein
MGNIKREIQIKLIQNNIIKGKFISQSPSNAYFELDDKGNYNILKENNFIDIFKSKGWEIPKGMENREGMDKGGRPRKNKGVN